MTISSVTLTYHYKRRLFDKSRRPQYKTSIRGASTGIPYKLWNKDATVGRGWKNCYSGTENLWSGNWNRHVCHQWKCEHMTVPPNRQRLIQVRSGGVSAPLSFLISCSTGYIWPRYFSNSGFFMDKTIIDVPVCEIEPRRQLFPPGWEQSLYQFGVVIWVKKYGQAGRGAQFVPIGIPTICWRTFPAKTSIMLSTRNSSITDDVDLQSTSVWSQSDSLQSMILRDQKLYICICDYRFWTWSLFPNDTSEFVLQFIVRNSRLKSSKAERFDACYIVQTAKI